jgi:hypothetical protein
MHDVLDLAGKEARIDCVQNASRARRAIVDFKMPIALPGKGRDAVPGFRAEGIESVRDSLRALGDFE